MTEDIPEERRICSYWGGSEHGRTCNATIEILAIALFRDRLPQRMWTRESHQTREYFRSMAEGRAPLDGPLP